MKSAYEELIIGWATAKGIPLQKSNAINQLAKTQEELEELKVEVNYFNGNNGDRLRLELGDVLVTLALQCEIWGTDIETCLCLAYEKIIKRTGKIVNGVFVKD